jgi:hypothetical protein
MLNYEGSHATKPYKVIDQWKISAHTFQQSKLEKKEGGSIEFEPFTVNIMNPDGEFDPNDIFLYYYEMPHVNK